MTKLTRDERQPIYYSETEKDFWPATLYSPGKAVLHIPNGAIMSLYCRNNFATTKFRDFELLRVKCFLNVLKADDGVLDDSSIVNIESILCREKQVPEQRVTKRPCAERGQIIQVYYNAGCQRLVLYESCHEAKYHANHYVHHFMTPANSAYQRASRATNFIGGGIFGNLDLDDLYTKAEVRSEFHDVWGSNVVNILPKQGSQYIARGHLMANKDGVLGNYQRGTFFYVNVMPQFQCSNGCNWLTIEKAIRRFVGVYNRNIEIFTGTVGVMKYEGVLLYLSSIYKKHLFPIPNLFYKMLINHESHEAMVVVSVNNVLPRGDEINEFLYCDDYSDETGMFDVKFNDEKRQRPEKGFIYICKIDDFLYSMGEVKMLSWSEYSGIKNYNLMHLRTTPSSSLDECEDNLMC